MKADKTDDELRELLFKVCENSQAKWAKEHGFSAQYINRVINGKANMTEKIARILGYRRNKKPWILTKPE